MKHFKSKFNFFSIFLKKKFYDKKYNSILFKLSLKNFFLRFNNIFAKIIPRKIKKFNFDKLKINYLAFIFGIIFFSYLIYLTLPGVLYDESDQNYLTKILKKKT